MVCGNAELSSRASTGNGSTLFDSGQRSLGRKVGTQLENTGEFDEYDGDDDDDDGAIIIPWNSLL